jgi:hypothetical protein
MRDEIFCGPVPADEQCEQLGPNYDGMRARKECHTFIQQIRRELGEEPEGAHLRIKGQSHDYGTYVEVVCAFECDDPVAAEYAFKCETTATKWDEKARQELGL